MAFSTPYTDRFGNSYPALYCRVTVLSCNKVETQVQVLGYKDQNAAPINEVPGFEPVLREVQSLPTNMNLQALNPLQYGYSLLEESGLYPSATWNM